MKEHNHSDPDETDIAALLQAAGYRRELPPALKQAWAGHFERELATVIERKRQRRRGLWSGMAAALVLVFAGSLYLRQPAPAPLAFELLNTSADNLLFSAGRPARTPQAGELLKPGSRVETAAGGFMAISYNGYDLRIGAQTRLRLDRGQIELQQGRIYLDDQAAAEGILVQTALGSVRDIGTQFIVEFSDRGLTSLVRRGTIVLERGAEQVTAGADGAERVSLAPDGKLMRTPASGIGEEWRWIYDSGPGFTLEGASVYEFLRWSCDESGHTLRFLDRAAEVYARTTVLHGTLGGLDPEQALAPVLLSTHLRASTVANELRVALTPRD